MQQAVNLVSEIHMECGVAISACLVSKRAREQKCQNNAESENCHVDPRVGQGEKLLANKRKTTKKKR